MHLALRHRILVASLAAGSLTGCSIAKQIFTPEQARLEESSARQRAEVAQYPDGECSSAESCKDRCEVLERALDCYKTGKAALGGVDAHYAGGWRTEAVAGSTDDINVHYQQESEEHISLMPLARESFKRACTAGHAESCRISGDLIKKGEPDAAAAFYRKACDLHDEPACAKTPGSK
jgi:TPR repeat protein